MRKLCLGKVHVRARSTLGWLCLLQPTALIAGCSVEEPRAEERARSQPLTNAAVSSMHGPHADHASVDLPDGSVLACGGHVEDTVFDGCDLYDPRTGLWSGSEWPSFPSPRQQATLTWLDGGRVLLSGGAGPDARSLGEAVVGTRDGWSREIEAIASRSAHTTTRLNDGGVLLLGGFFNDGTVGIQTKVELRSADSALPPAERWTLARGGEQRLLGHAATLLREGHDVLVSGGEDEFGAQTSWAQTYNLKAGSWQPAASMNYPRSRHTATLLDDGKVLVVGGLGFYSAAPLSQAEVYDPRTDQWELTNPTRARVAHVAGRLGPYVVVAGGVDAQFVLNSVEIYDPATGIWRPLPPLSTPRQYARLNNTTTPDGRPALLVSGGSDAGASKTAELIAPALLGLECTKDSECASGHCADGVCCEGACRGVCEGCDRLGTCVNVAGAPWAGHGTCAGGLVCDGRGACLESCGTSDDCSSGYYCDEGRCMTALNAGRPCAADSQCLDGFCAAGVCCTTRCDGSCEACDEHGQCQKLKGAPRIDGDCPVARDSECAASCDGKTRDCQFTVGVACGEESCDVKGNVVRAGACDGAGRCQQETVDCVAYRCDAGACRETCDGDSSCALGHFCHQGRCLAVEGLGEACDVRRGADACSTGLTCVDAVCCAEPACDDDSICLGPSFTCKRALGRACETDSECESANCVDDTCCSSASCPGSASCANEEGECRSALGVACQSETECASGFCVEGVCCEAASCAAGSSCALENQAGHCRARTGASCSDDQSCASGHCLRGACVECVADGDCARPLLCDPRNHCSLPPAAAPPSAGCSYANSAPARGGLAFGGLLAWLLLLRRERRARSR